MSNKANNRYTKQKSKKAIRSIALKGKGTGERRKPKNYVYMMGGSCGMSFIGDEYDGVI